MATCGVPEAVEVLRPKLVADEIRAKAKATRLSVLLEERMT
jgi:hypothetical protein